MNTEIKKQLDDVGFYVFRDVVPKEEYLKGQDAMRGATNHYGKLEKYIMTSMVDKVNQLTGLDLIATKYRGSNNNNSTDAAAFHRDVMVQNQSIKLSNIYTLLNYLDDSTLEIIPESHRHLEMSHLESIKFFFKTKQIKFGPGDLLLFDATLLHRGMFGLKQKNRRLIQVFDVIPRKLHSQLNPKILHLPCHDKCKDKRARIISGFSHLPLVKTFMNVVCYLNSANGYQISLKDRQKLGVDQYDYYATEAEQARLEPDYKTYQTSNLYVVLDKPVDLTDVEIREEILYHTHRKGIAFYCIMLLILLVLLGTGTYFLVKYLYAQMVSQNASASQRGGTRKYRKKGKK